MWRHHDLGRIHGSPYSRLLFTQRSYALQSSIVFGAVPTLGLAFSEVVAEGDSSSLDFGGRAYMMVELELKGKKRFQKTTLSRHLEEIGHKAEGYTMTSY